MTRIEELDLRLNKALGEVTRIFHKELTAEMNNFERDEFLCKLRFELGIDIIKDKIKEEMRKVASLETVNPLDIVWVD
jgi:hypothetical protein